MIKRFEIIAVLFTLLIAGCSEKSDEKGLEDKNIVPVKVISIDKENVQLSIAASGKFTTDDETFLSFKTGGVINRIYVKEGSSIKKGQLLASLNLGEIESMVSQAKTGYEKALRDYNRVSNLYKDSVATLEQFENTKTALDIAGKDLKIAEFNLSYSEIRALDNGYVLKVFSRDGEMTGPGMPVIQTNGASKGNWFLKVSVSDWEWATIKLNDNAEVELDTYPGNKYRGVVQRKSEGVDPYTGTFTIDIRLLSPEKSKIASGLFGKAKIFPDQKIDTWVIPYEALLDADGNYGYVFVTYDNKTAQKIKVTIAELQKENILVSAGLEAGGFLIVSGSPYLKENSEIRIVK